MTENSRISVVVPTYNEAALVRGALKHLIAIQDISEIIVVDGGSQDLTMELAAEFEQVRVTYAPKGRATQMNAGAALCHGDILVFLHVDVSLPTNACHWIRQILSEPGTVAGAFRTKTVADGKRPVWAPLLRLADLRSRYTRLPYGDQALFMRADVFHRAGGFPVLPLMEDVELSRQLRQMGRVRVAPAVVRVSGRRFIARPLFYTMVMNIFPFLYRVGVPLRMLRGFYEDVR